MPVRLCCCSERHATTAHRVSHYRWQAGGARHLARLVKAALAGEEMIIASHGKAQVKLVPCASAAGSAAAIGTLGCRTTSCSQPYCY